MNKTFIIIGANSINKGAQAMMFATAHELMKTYPGCEVWVFSNIKERDIYNFNIFTWDGRIVIRLLLGKLKKVLGPRNNKDGDSKIDSLLKKADCIYDISGFALSAQFGFKHSLNYLLKIALAKKYKCKMILLPQSFGPFNFQNIFQKILINLLMKNLLKYPEYIYCREAQGFKALGKYTKANLRQSLDIVLLTEKPDLHKILKKETYTRALDVQILKINRIAAIIPNSKVKKWNKENDIMLAYKALIELLLDRDYKVIIIRHSQEDLAFCKEIFNMFMGSHQLELFIDDYHCIELHELISEMDFVIASRYHSLIHAYKSGVPALVIGWAEKYPEVMKEFGQEHYYFDVRDKIDINDISDAAKKIMNNTQSEKIVIREKLLLEKKSLVNLTRFDAE